MNSILLYAVIAWLWLACCVLFIRLKAMEAEVEQLRSQVEPAPPAVAPPTFERGRGVTR